MVKDQRKVDEVFSKVMTSTLEGWFNLIPEKLPGDVRVIVCPETMIDLS
jgi:hypothetical protein